MEWWLHGIIKNFIIKKVKKSFLCRDNWLNSFKSAGHFSRTSFKKWLKNLTTANSGAKNKIFQCHEWSKTSEATDEISWSH